MWMISLHWWEFVLRATVIYVALMILLRLTGKRQVGQLAPFDLVLLLMLSNAVQNGMNGGDNSVIGAFILAGTLVALNYVVGYVTFHNKHIEQLVEGRPIILIHGGHVDRGAMRKAQMTMHELESALRAEGFCGPEDVRFALLENNGHVTVIPMHAASGN
jgi:uncharacterized membrane protein YcaP (DUF421 family)